MGKNRHSKDKMYITATEWSQEYGGKKTTREAASRPLPFDHCALSLTPFRTPVLLGKNSGVIFDFEVIVPYLQEHKCDPVSGDAMTTKDIIRLHMTKNAAGEWEWYVPAYYHTVYRVADSNEHVFYFSFIFTAQSPTKYSRILLMWWPSLRRVTCTRMEP